jgi:hypothetical protein
MTEDGTVLYVQSQLTRTPASARRVLADDN